MARRVVLHVGLMKSGTSYIQHRLGHNRAQLSEHGVLFPGPTWRDQVRAVKDVIGRRESDASSSGRWRALVDEIAAYDGTGLVSMEFLGSAPPERIATVLDSFSGTPVEVVLTLRDLGRGVPAMWQETLQNGRTDDWEAYTRLLDGKRAPARNFWRQQGMGRIAESWAAAAGQTRLTLVTVPAPGAPPALLWDRFGTAIGHDLTWCQHVPPANTSLDARSAMLLRELNVRLADDGLARDDYHKLVKFGLAKRVLAGRDGPTVGYEPTPWLRDRAARIAGRLQATGARVVGDLADLDPVTVLGVDPRTFEDAALAAEAEALRMRILSQVAELRRQRGSGRPRPHSARREAVSDAKVGRDRGP